MSEAEDKIEPFEDPHHEWNGAAYHTGKPCIESGCDNPAGTAWSPLWCFSCNVGRMRRIRRQIEALAEALRDE